VIDMTYTREIHNQIIQKLQTLKRELDRLNIRQYAIDRCRLAVLAQKTSDESDEDDDSLEEITTNLDSLTYDLTTFKEQLRERYEHLESGLRLLSMLKEDKVGTVFYQYILDGVKLSVRDAKVAREGYDELINDVKEITRLRDQ
jgi:hypothetical protein